MLDRFNISSDLSLFTASSNVTSFASSLAGSSLPQPIETFSAPDYNWIYSTLSQSAAAFIGLMGAFLISRLIQQIAINAEKRSQILVLFDGITDSLLKLYGGLMSYMLFYDEIVESAKEAWNLSVTEILVDRDCTPTSCEFYDVPKKRKINLRIIEGWQKKADSAREVGALIHEFIMINRIDAIRSTSAKFSQLLSGENELKSEVFDDIMRMNELRRKSDEFIDTRNPSYFSRIYWVLVFIAVASVIFPITLLCGYNYLWQKLSLVVLFAIGIAMVFFWIGKIISEIDELASLEIPKAKPLDISK